MAVERLQLKQCIACLIHQEKPNVQRLQVHLPREQVVTIRAEERLDEVREVDTTLPAWFKFNAFAKEALLNLAQNQETVTLPHGSQAKVTDLCQAFQTTYQDFPSLYRDGNICTWVQCTQSWQVRQNKQANPPLDGFLICQSIKGKCFLKSFVKQSSRGNEFHRRQNRQYWW